MKNISRKLRSLAIAGLLIGFSSISYAEEISNNQEQVTTSIYNPSEQDKMVLFTFMRKNALLNNLLTVIYPTNDSWTNTYISRIEAFKLDYYYPLRTLYSQLNTELINLVGKEEKVLLNHTAMEQAIKSLKSMVAEIKTEAGFNTLAKRSLEKRNVADRYPNLVDSLILSAAVALDVSTFLAATNQEGFSEAEAQELKELMYNQEKEDYKQFVEANKDILNKINQMAKAGFKMEAPKKCITNHKTNKTICTESKHLLDIKSLRDIIPYIQKKAKESQLITKEAL